MDIKYDIIPFVPSRHGAERQGGAYALSGRCHHDSDSQNDLETVRPDDPVRRRIERKVPSDFGAYRLTARGGGCVHPGREGAVRAQGERLHSGLLDRQRIDDVRDALRAGGHRLHDT